MRPHLWLIKLIGLIVPQRLRADWRQEWEAELKYREAMLAEWDRLNWRGKLDLTRRSIGAFWDALWYQSYRWEDEMIQDLRYGLRMLVKNPVFTIVAVLSLALGIGANTAIFSLVDAMLLRTLPVKDPHQLALLSINRQNSTQYSFNYPLFEQFRKNTLSLTGIIAAGAPERTKLVVTDQEMNAQRETAQTVKVSGNFFSVLGIDAINGRTLVEDDDKDSHPQPVAVISYDFWKRRFALEPTIVGKKITLNDFPFTIVGVAPPGFFGFEVGRKPDLWYPIQTLPLVEPGSPLLKESGASWMRVMGRLQPGANLSQAREELDVLLRQQNAQIIAERPRMLESTRSMFETMRIELEQGSTGWTGLRQQFKQPLLILMIVTGLVLLIACANVANLLLSRAASRRKEIAIRLALGAGRLRIIRQLLTESVLLAMVGGALGLLFAQWGARVLLTYLPSQRIAGFDFSLDTRILGFTLMISVLTGILFGLAPALETTRLDLITSLKNQASMRARPSRLALSKVLVVAQVALSLFLLIGAGLFVRTLQNLKSIDAGFAWENLTQFGIDTGKDYNVTQRVNLYKQVLARMETMPGVRSASLLNFSLLTGSRIYNKVKVPGYVPQTEDDAVCNMLYVGPKFFETMGMQLLSGQDFDQRYEINSELKNSAPLYAVINQTMARHFFPNENPIGKRFNYETGSEKDRPFEVIGMVSDAKYMSLREEMPKTYYVSYFQKPTNGSMTIQIRTVGDISSLAASVQQVVQEIDPKLQASELETMSNIVNESTVQERFIAQLASFFSLFALLLVSIGLYGIMSYSVTRRTNEIGIRMALGAQSWDVIKMVMRESMLLVVTGSVIGLGAALATTRLISSFLFGLTPTDPLTICVAVLVMIAVAAVAGYLPARRASRVDPLTALRYE